MPPPRLAIYSEDDLTPHTQLIVALTLGAFALISCAPDENPTHPTTGGDELSAAPSFALGANSWTTRARMPTGRGSLALAVANSGGKPILYAIGGDEGRFSTDTVEAYNVRDHNLSRQLHVFDPATRQWTTKAPMPTVRSGAAGAVLGNKLYVIGGGTGSGTPVNTVQAYDPAKNTWSTRASMPTARAQLAVVRATLDGQSRIFAVARGPLAIAMRPTLPELAFSSSAYCWGRIEQAPLATARQPIARGRSG